MKKRPLFFLFLSFLTGWSTVISLQAGVPNRIVYQGRLSKSGVAVAGPHTFSARIYPAANSNVSLWQSGNLPINLPATGEFSLVLDINTDINWLTADPKLEITVDGEKLSPDESFGTNPYAFAAKTVDTGGVNTAAIQNAAVTDVKVSTISASKIMLPGTASPLTVWQSTVAGQLDKIDSAKIHGSIPTIPSTHANSHAEGGTDPISIIPPGTIWSYAGLAAPTGWLLCDGAAVSRTTYARLFGVVGTTYGPGNGSTTFNLPDFRGRVAMGAGLGSGLTNRTLGQNIGEETHALSTQETAPHNHGGTTLLGGVNHSHITNSINYSNSQVIASPQGWAYFSNPKLIYATAADGNADHIYLEGYDHTHGSAGASVFLHTHTFTTDGTTNGVTPGQPVVSKSWV